MSCHFFHGLEGDKPKAHRDTRGPAVPCCLPARVNRELQSKAARPDMTMQVPLRLRSSCQRGHDEARSEAEYGAPSPGGQHEYDKQV
jgi:hypothetical protein